MEMCVVRNSMLVRDTCAGMVTAGDPKSGEQCFCNYLDTKLAPIAACITAENPEITTAVMGGECAQQGFSTSPPGTSAWIYIGIVAGVLAVGALAWMMIQAKKRQQQAAQQQQAAVAEKYLPNLGDLEAGTTAIPVVAVAAPANAPVVATATPVV